MKLNYWLAILSSLLLFTCSPKVERIYVESISLLDEAEQRAVLKTRIEEGYCRKSKWYEPDPSRPERMPKKIIKVNVHCMLSEEEDNNFTEANGVAFIQNFIYQANQYLESNLKMALPEGNDIPVYPANYYYEITPDPNQPGDDGIYFHRDNELYFSNGVRGKGYNMGKSDVFKKYGVQKGEVLNIFFMEHHLDSLKSKTYIKQSRGIAFGNWVKLLGVYTSAQDTTYEADGNPYLYGVYHQQRNLNHEVGHCVGLKHSWYKNDGCDDTPVHANCWSMSGKPPCDKYAPSNNMMDYIAVPQAITPCQIGRAHMTMSDTRKKVRGCVKKTWCELDSSNLFVIKENTDWNAARDINGHIIIRNGARLTLRCRLSLPKGGKIIVYPKGELILDGATLENDCGDTWDGIEILKDSDSAGKVFYLDSPRIKNIAHPIKVI